jgi:hypothetical protein
MPHCGRCDDHLKPRGVIAIVFGIRWPPQTRCELRRMFRRSSAVVATSRACRRSPTAVPAVQRRLWAPERKS